MSYEILNVSPPDSEGNLGRKWSLFSIDISNPIKPVIRLLETMESPSINTSDQFATVNSLLKKMIQIDPSVKVSEATITGEYLSLGEGDSSVVKLIVRSFINQM